jgi:60 kDa SS-A/Ro ribonucleoprotein
MSQLNSKASCARTHESAVAFVGNPFQQLKRSVMCCLLWESSAYENGESIVDRIIKLIPQVTTGELLEIIRDAKIKNKLRHLPLLLLREMIKDPKHRMVTQGVQYVFEITMDRPDNLPEFLALYWEHGKCPLAAQVKKGLAKAFSQFNEYQLGKYNRDNKIKLRDILFLCHAKPKDKEQEALWKNLINDELAIPKTWEVIVSDNNELSKKEKWEKVIDLWIQV